MDRETSPDPKLGFDGCKYQNMELLVSCLPEDEDQVPHIVLALWTNILLFLEGFMGVGFKDDGLFRAWELHIFAHPLSYPYQFSILYC